MSGSNEFTFHLHIKKTWAYIPVISCEEAYGISNWSFKQKDYYCNKKNWFIKNSFKYDRYEIFKREWKGVKIIENVTCKRNVL